MKTINLPILAFLLFGTLCNSHLRAAGVITNCNEASLLSALQGGGVVTFASEGTIYLTNTITISEDTVLDGNGNSVSISGGHAVRIFAVESNANFTISNLLLADGKSIGDSNSTGLGGAIRNYGNDGVLIAVNCVFSNNVAEGFELRGRALGGAIASGGPTFLTNTTFILNQAIGHRGLDGMPSLEGGSAEGGAILAGELVAVNCVFLTNSAIGGDARAGAIACSGGPNSISNCIFEGNFAQAGLRAEGGAISTDGINVQDSAFTGNYVTANYALAGAIVLEDYGSYTFQGCTFSQNASIGALAGSSAIAGAVKLGFGGNLSASHCSFEQNCVIGGGFDDAPELIGPAQGGAIDAGPGSSLHLSSSLFVSNSVVGGSAYGGAISTVSPVNYFNETIFQQNTTTARGGIGGGAAIMLSSWCPFGPMSCIRGFIQELNECVFSSNLVTLELTMEPGSFAVGANALFNVSGDNLSGLSCQWLFNETNSISGQTAPSYLKTNLVTNDAGVYGVRFEDDIGRTKSLSLSFSPTISLTPQNQTNFPGDTVTFSIGATGTPLYYQWFFNSVPILNATTANYTFTAQSTNFGNYSVMVSNLAGNATASAVLDDASWINLSECTEAALREVLAQSSKIRFQCDGTIYLTNTMTFLNSTVLDGNGHTVSISGGGSNRVFHVQTNVQVTLKDLAVIDGFSTNGGGIYNDGGNVAITNCSFVGNRVVGTNGRDFASDPHDRGGSSGGGAIFNSGAIQIAASIFSENHAVGGNGGALWSPAGGAGRGGEGNGGAILNFGKAFVFDSSFYTNLTRGGVGIPGGIAAGGAIYNSSELMLSNCVFDANISFGGSGAEVYGRVGSRAGDSYGGAVCNRAGTVEQLLTSYIANRSVGGSSRGQIGTAVGGAYFNADNGQSVMKRCDFEGNSAGGAAAYGGACYNELGLMGIDLCNMVSNSVSSVDATDVYPAEGGAVFNLDRLLLSNSVIANNTAKAGNGIPFQLFNSNDARDGGDAGGGGLFNSGLTEVTNCSFLSNTIVAGAGSIEHSYGKANNGKARGAGIANFGGLLVSDSRVNDNVAMNSADGGAAGIFTTNNVTTYNSEVVSNWLSLELKLSVDGGYAAGSDVDFFVSGQNLPESGYEWFSSETNLIVGQTGRSYILNNLQTNDAGVYLVRFEDNVGGVRSLSASVAPTLMAAPQSQTKVPGETVTFSVGVTGAPLYYQWFFNSVSIPNATSANLVFTAQLTNIGTYSVVVSNLAGTETAFAQLNMRPVFTVVPQSQIASLGESIRFNAVVGGTEPFIYQWQLNGDPIPEATNASYVISPLGNMHNGNYSLVVSNDFGFALSPNAALTLFNLVHWQKNDGTLAMWKFQGTNFMQSTLVSGPSGPNPAWRMIGLNDFNDDGQIDYLWRKTNGALAIWFMNQTNQIGTALLRNGQPISSAWRFVGFGDFNGDTRKDILWQNTDRRLAAWFMNGTNFLGSGPLRNGQAPGLGWRAMGVHDFDHDGHSDVLLQHDDRSIAIWKMSETNFVSRHVLRNGKPTPPGWRIAGLSDFNDDGEKDILIRNTDGRLAVWFMGETDFVSAVLLRSGPANSTGWRTVGVR